MVSAVTSPLVSIICLCYNHEQFVEDAIESVAWQDYPDIECILIDDNSCDGSRTKIEQLKLRFPWLKVILNDSNIGMCKSFNNALKHARGEYVIDLAADDMMHPFRVSRQIKKILTLPENYGVVFTDAWIMNETGIITGTFYSQKSDIESGNIFASLLKKYSVCAPSILIKRSVLESIGGYNTSLSYEDYDFFIRSSRHFNYYFLNERLTFHRTVKRSCSSRWYTPYKNPFLESTFLIHQHALLLLENEAEQQSLEFNIAFHWRQSVYLQINPLAIRYQNLLAQFRPLNKNEKLLKLTSSIIPLAPFYLIYIRVKKIIKEFRNEYKSKKIHWKDIVGKES